MCSHNENRELSGGVAVGRMIGDSDPQRRGDKCLEVRYCDSCCGREEARRIR